MLLQNTSRIGNCVMIMGRNESDGSLKENDHEITINKAKLSRGNGMAHPARVLAGAGHRGVRLPAAAVRRSRLRGASSVVPAHVRVWTWPFCMAARVSVPWPWAAGVAGSGLWGSSSCPALSSGRCSLVVEPERGRGCCGWRGWRLARPCPAGTSREVALTSAFPRSEVKMLLQGRGVSPGAWGEIPFP